MNNIFKRCFRYSHCQLFYLPSVCRDFQSIFHCKKSPAKSNFNFLNRQFFYFFKNLSQKLPKRHPRRSQTLTVPLLQIPISKIHRLWRKKIVIKTKTILGNKILNIKLLWFSSYFSSSSSFCLQIFFSSAAETANSLCSSN